VVYAAAFFICALKSGFVPRSLFVLPLLACTACNRLPDAYPPPVQRAALSTAPQPGGLGYFVTLSDPRSDIYFVRDIAPSDGSGSTWALDHPVLQFFVPAVPRLRFTMDFALPERTFRETGPVTLTFHINGELLDRARYDAAGQQHYDHPVPPGMLHPNAINLVAIDPDPVWVSKVDGGRIGFILARAGFTD
jgi:hypothetical protein